MLFVPAKNDVPAAVVFVGVSCCNDFYCSPARLSASSSAVEKVNIKLDEGYFSLIDIYFGGSFLFFSPSSYFFFEKKKS